MKNIKKIATLLFILLTGTIILHAQNAGDKMQSSKERKYVKVEVDGLACPFRAYGLEKKLKKITGAQDVFVSLKNGFATLNVPKDSDLTKDKLRDIVKDAGFATREVSFSDKPFAEDEK